MAVVLHFLAATPALPQLSDTTGTAALVALAGGLSLVVAGAWSLFVARRRSRAAEAGESSYRATFADAPVGLAHVSLDGRWLRFNDALCRITGYSREELERLTFGEITHPDDLEADGEQARALLRGALERYSVEKRYLRKDGRSVWVQLSVSLARDAAGAPLHFVSVVDDVEERVALREELRRSERTLRLFLDNAPSSMGLVELAPDGSDLLHLVDNAATERFFGVGPGRTAGRWARRDLGASAETVARWVEAYRAALERGAPVRLEHEFTAPGAAGAPPRTLSLAVAVSHVGRGDEGRERFCYSALDDTDRRLAEHALAESEERRRVAQEAAQLGIFDFDLASNRIRWDTRTRELWGVGPDEPIDLDVFFAGLHPDDVAPTQVAIDRATDPAGDGEYFAEYRVVHRGDGVARWVSARGRVSFEDGLPSRLAGTVQEVTDRRHAEEALRASERFLRGVLDNLLAFVAVLTPDGTLIEVNRGPLTRAGLRREDVIGRKFWDTPWWSYSPAVQERIRSDIERACAGEVVRYDARPRMEHHLLWIDFQLAPLRDEEGRITHLVPSGFDIAARKRAEEELRRTTDELQAEDRRKEQFLATLGHELRNPLSALDSAVHALGLGIGEPRQVVRTLTEQVHQLSSLVDDLLEVSRVTRGKISLRRRPTDLAQVLRGAVESVRSSVRAREQDLRVDLSGPLFVDGDATRLLQVVSNLLSNASKFTPEHGRIDLALRREGGEAVIEVLDQGAGIERAHLERIFHPFVQADPGVGGLGIGLALVHGLVELHGGSVVAESEGLGRGSRFVLRLPLGEQAEAAEPDSEPEPRRLPADSRVLIVDDVRDSADLLALLLRHAGASTRCAYTATDGLQEYEAWSPQVALVDLGLPDLPGYEVARRIRTQPGGERPLLVAVTGFGDPGAERRALEAGFDARLVKPVDHERLHELLAAHLGSWAGDPDPSGQDRGLDRPPPAG